MSDSQQVSGRPGDRFDQSSAHEPWGIAVLLMLVGILNILDRILPGFLAELIKHDLGLSDAALGFINGFGFLLVYAVAGIPIAKLADGGRHAFVISGALFLWSATTALGGLARNGIQFGLSRVGVALGEAGCSPASHAFIAQNFSNRNRATALSMITLGGPIGILVAMVGGGMIAEQFGWRVTMIVVGLTGMALAPITYLMLRRGRPTAVDASSDSARWRDFALLLRKRSALCTVLGAAMIATASYSLNAFGAAFFMRVHKLPVGEVGMWLGWSAGILGMVVLMASGALADRLSQRDPRWLLRVVAVLQIAAIPLAASAFLVGTAIPAIVCFALASACMNSYVAPTVAALYRLVLPEMRARTSAVLLFATAVVGGAGPFLVGLLSDGLLPTLGEDSLRYALMLVPFFSMASVLLLFFAAADFKAETID